MVKKAQLDGFEGKYFTVLYEAEHKIYESGNKFVMWSCKCRCGNLFTSTSGTINSRKDRLSCGCMRFKDIIHGNSKVDPKLVTYRHIINRYKQTSSRRRLNWQLTEKHAIYLFSSNCHYCGDEPSNKTNVYITSDGNHRSKNAARSDEAWVSVNGIDRVDNNIGYLKSNCVPCCFKCNSAKSNGTYKEFIEWLSRLSQYRIRTESTGK